jgi:haloalkane dehalogenase
MKILRTPDERFEGLPGYPFEAHYVQIPAGDGDELRMHYLDEGPRDGEVILCLHGQPVWSYLYRKMIPVLVKGGYRVIAPDLVGFGKSDKPAQRSDYTYANHVAWLTSLLSSLELSDLTMVCQDWGGLLGLRALTEHPDWFARAVVANTGLPDAKGIPDEMAGPMRTMLENTPALPLPEMFAKLSANENGVGFMYWVKYCAEFQDLDIGAVVNLSSGDKMNADEIRAYEAPFPDETYKQGARQFPSLVPIIPDDPAIPANREGWKVLEAFEKPLITIFGESDPVSQGGEKRFRKSVPGAQGQKHQILKGVGHFLQEEVGEEFAALILDFCKANPIRSGR